MCVCEKERVCKVQVISGDLGWHPPHLSYPLFDRQEPQQSLLERPVLAPGQRQQLLQLGPAPLQAPAHRRVWGGEGGC